MELASNQVYASDPREKAKVPNLIQVKFDQLLSEQSRTFAGESQKCRNCQAILTKISKLSAPDSRDGPRMWVCEFCLCENKLTISDQEIPPESVSFLVKPAPTVQLPDGSFGTEIMQYFVYCIDVSGSMCQSIQISSDIKLPTDEFRKGLYLQNEGSNENPSMRYISRLECVQVAILESLAEIEKRNPEKRVALVTFNDHVKVIGDGKASSMMIENLELESEVALQSSVQKLPAFENIGRNRGKLREKIIELVDNGLTALGPALYLSILLAARKPCGQVLLCTDGKANVGLGRLDEEIYLDKSRSFYENVITLANAKGVSVSIVTIKENECELGILGEVATRTKGTIRVVDPLKLREEFSSIAMNGILATNVIGRFILPKEFYVKDYENPTRKNSTVIKEIGNVTESSEISFALETRPDAVVTRSKIPIQLQLTFTAQDGSEQLKVITMEREVTRDEKTFTQNIDATIVASHVIRAKSELVQKGLESAELDSVARNVLEIKNSKTERFNRTAFEKSMMSLKNIETKAQSEYIPRKEKNSRRRPSLTEEHLNVITENLNETSISSADNNNNQAAQQNENMIRYVGDVDVSEHNRLANTNSENLSTYRKRTNPSN